MRVKLQCLPPLPALKLWFAVDLDTVGDLKTSLAKNVPGLGASKTGLRVLLDDFELLDWQATRELLRDGDLLVIKQAESNGAPSSSLAQSSSNAQPKKAVSGMKRKRSPSTSSSSDTSSDSSSSDSSDDTSDDTDSDSDSSSSSSDSSSDSDGAPLMASSKRPMKAPAPKKPALTKPPPMAPPGQGKNATRERNRRRREQRKRQSEGDSAPVAGAPKVLSVANGITLGSGPQALARPSEWHQPVDLTELTMFSLRNKNKSKNFRKNLKPPVGPRRIVFADEASVEEPPTIFAEDPATSRLAQAPLQRPASGQTHLPRLVPPSERTDLPPNVFVTSIDVEAGAWNSNGGAQWQEQSYVDEQPYVEKPSYVDEDQQMADAADVQLSYDLVAPPAKPASTDPAWDTLAQKYASSASQLLSGPDQVKAGAYVGWTSLELNPVTMTPEMVVVLARVMRVDASGEGDDARSATLTVRRVPRPQEGEAHGLLVNVVEEDAEGQGEEEEVYTLRDAVDGGWRVLP